MYFSLCQFLIGKYVSEKLEHSLLHSHHVFGPRERLALGIGADVQNALFNTNSGTIDVGEMTFFGHNVTVLTGTHNYELVGAERRDSFPTTGHNVFIGNGVWVGTNVTIIGPCNIGDNSVIAAGSVVTNDVDPATIVGGIPARFIKRIMLARRED